MRILFNVFVVFCLFFSAESITNVRHSIECEHEELTLKCENNKVLNILDGNYGRTTSSTCMKGGNNNVTCYQENSLAVLSDLCEGRSECSVNANNDVFGDPCPGTVKYLFVLYRCVSIEEYKYSLSCENKPVHLDCPKGKVIQIHGANYGRRSQITCTDGPIKTTNCVSDLSADIVSRLCNNKKSCVLMANNNVFGDPCVGTYKYLSVKYKCVPGLDDCTSKLSSNQDIQCLDGSTIVPSMLCDGKKDCPYGDDELTCSYDTKFACEHNKLEMKCKKDETIKIINANYGRTSWKVCPQKDIKDDMDCRAGTSTQIVQQKCAGKHKCEIKANNNIFGDPCSGIVKYLEVNFECEPSARNVIACEREIAELKCENGKMINILDANYGRTTLLTCTDGPVTNTTCYSEDSMDIISNICSNRQHCSIEAKNQIFGDSCPDTYKYLNILYECVTLTDFKLSVKCERKTAHLECESGKVIRVLDANFGRKSRIICPEGPVHTTNCHSKDSLPIVFDECENKQSCNVLASTSVFGDPCPNTNKYLTVRYECIRDTPKEIPKYYNRDQDYQNKRKNFFECFDGKEIRKSYICNGIYDCPDGEDEFDCDYDTTYACEGKTLNLECNTGEVIKIINGNYGRLSTKVCPRESESRRINCEAENSASILQDKCDGRVSCNVRSANSVFGDPCPDTYKYTEVHYQCVTDPRRFRRFMYGF